MRGKETVLPPTGTQNVEPNGHNDNSITKESTSNKPELIELPKFKYKIPNTSWMVVITNLGSQFYYNEETKESCWQNEVGDQLTDEEKRMLIVLIAKVRGLRVGTQVEEELQEFFFDNTAEVDSNNEMDIDNALDDETQADQEPVIDKTESKMATGLIQGYSSDESSDEEDELAEDNETEQIPSPQAEQKSPPKQRIEIEDMPTLVPQNENSEAQEDSDDDKNGINLSDLDSSDEEEAPSVFISLLQETKINPYEPWETASRQLLNDPRFHSVSDNATRKTLYDSHAQELIQNQDQEDTETASVELHPFVQFMKLLECIDPPRLFIDFKKQFGEQLKGIDLSDRIKEKHYKEYVIFRKKSDSDKVKIFRQVLSAKIFGKNAKESGANLARDINGDPYLTLKTLEDGLNVSESIKFQTKYYAVDVKQRIELLIEEARKYI